MPTLTLTIPDDVMASLQKYPWVNWSEIGRAAFLERERRGAVFRKFDALLKDSKMTDQLAIKLASELKQRVARRHGL